MAAIRSSGQTSTPTCAIGLTCFKSIVLYPWPEHLLVPPKAKAKHVLLAHPAAWPCPEPAPAAVAQVHDTTPHVPPETQASYRHGHDMMPAGNPL